MPERNVYETSKTFSKYSFQNRYYIENNLEIQIMFLSFHLKVISTFPPQNLFPFMKEIYLNYKVLVACKQMIQVEN